jgi:glucan phosphoethanolaminetransferase (alkaline phosphatase superfamily)
LPLALPTLVSIAVDLVLRGHDFVLFEPHGKAIYVSSLLVSTAFWVLPLLVGARLVTARGGKRPRAASAALVLLFGAWLLPLLACCYAGQLTYYRVFHSYIGRDTLRLGALLRGGFGPWFFAWSNGAGLAVILASGAVMTVALYLVVRRAAPDLSEDFPLLPVLTFLGAAGCFWIDDAIDSRYLQAATPDVCFVHSAVHALRAAVTGVGRVREGVTLRAPAPLPSLVSDTARPPSIVFIITESVRADVLCSDPPPECESRFLDAEGVAPDRIPLGKLTAQTPNTFSACMVLWTGLEPNVDFVEAHTAPLLWEIARAAGYRTFYVTSQNPKYEDFGVFVHRAGIDVQVTATELGGMEHEQLGAPDERATHEMLRLLSAIPAEQSYFAVLHLSNTHQPYRVDPDLSPFSPQSSERYPIDAYFNRYHNSVLMQERLVAGFIREVRALPSWDETAIVFVSDHGEPFGEHGIFNHNHSVFDEELRVPGWLVAGSRAVDARRRAALRTYAGVRTYAQDVNATLVDLFGLASQRAALPLSHRVLGRSLLRPREPSQDDIALLATATGVWEPYDPWFGVMHRERVVIGSVTSAWQCYDLDQDPDEQSPLPVSACPDLVQIATRAWAPGVGVGERSP